MNASTIFELIASFTAVVCLAEAGREAWGRYFSAYARKQREFDREEQRLRRAHQNASHVRAARQQYVLDQLRGAR